MKPSSLIFATASLVLLILAWYGYSSNREERERIQRVFEEGLEQGSSVARAVPTAVNPETAPAPTAKASTATERAPGPEPAPGLGWAPVVLDAKGMSPADWLKLNEAQRKVQNAYEFVVLGFPELSGEQKLRLKELMALRISGLALSPVLAADGSSVPGREAIEAEIRTLLGERRADLEELMALETVALELGTHPGLLTKHFLVSGVPLSDEARLTLARLFKKHGWEHNGPINKAAHSLLPADPVLGVRPIYAELIEASRGFLSPEQILAFIDYARSGEVR